MNFQSFIKPSFRVSLSLDILPHHTPRGEDKIKSFFFKKKASVIIYLFMYLFPTFFLKKGDFGIPKRLWSRDEGVRKKAAVFT